jgi:hypothetical protein
MVYRGSFTHASSPVLVVCFIDDCYSDWGKIESQYCFDLPFPLWLRMLNIFHILFFFFAIYTYKKIDTGVWTWDFVLARQVLYQLSHALSPFCFGYFLDRVSCFYLGWQELLLYMTFCFSLAVFNILSLFYILNVFTMICLGKVFVWSCPKIILYLDYH